MSGLFNTPIQGNDKFTMVETAAGQLPELNVGKLTVDELNVGAPPASVYGLGVQLKKVVAYSANNNIVTGLGAANTSYLYTVPDQTGAGTALNSKYIFNLPKGASIVSAQVFPTSTVGSAGTISLGLTQDSTTYTLSPVFTATTPQELICGGVTAAVLNSGFTMTTKGNVEAVAANATPLTAMGLTPALTSPSATVMTNLPNDYNSFAVQNSAAVTGQFAVEFTYSETTLP